VQITQPDRNNFTVLRLALALLVVLGHSHLLAGVGAPPWPFNYAAAAVDCFFVVSGYLIASSFDRDNDLRRFYLRRFFRIYPLYIAVVLAQTLFMAWLAPGGAAAHAGELLKYFAVNAVFANFLQHDVGGALSGLSDPSLNASLWTLKIEVGFYLFLPLIWVAVRRFGVGVLVGLFILSILYEQILEARGLPELARQLPGQLQFFVLGVAAYKYRPHMSFTSTHPLVGLGVTIALAVLLTALLRSQPPVVYPLVVAAFVIAVAFKSPAVPIRTDISYGVYLVHAPLIQVGLLYGLYRPSGSALLVLVLTTVALALVLEKLIERPGIAVGRRLSRRRPEPGRPPASTAATRTEDMNIVVLNDFCHVQGGASKVAIEEAISLARIGARVTFIGAVGPVCADLRAAPLTVVCLDQPELLDVGRRPWVILQGLWNFAAATQIALVLRGLSPERTVIHLHGYTKALTVSAARAARRLGYPVICTLHDFFAACPNGAFFDYRRGAPCGRQALSLGCITAHCDKRRYAHKLFRVARGFIQRAYGRFPIAIGHFISLSETSEAILTPYLSKQARIHRLHNGIDWPQPEQIDASANKTILYVGRLDQEKGAHLLAQVAASLRLSVLFVGDGPLRADIEALPGMTVTGWVSRDDVRRYVTQARCLVFPSLWYETYGLVVGEAAAYGVPAIVSSVSAAAERIEDGVTGWVFQSGDAPDLARCLRNLQSDDDVRAAGRAAYRSFWRTAQTNAAHAADLVTVYRSILSGA